jgi:hypothetical protein
MKAVGENIVKPSLLFFTILFFLDRNRKIQYKRKG